MPRFGGVRVWVGGFAEPVVYDRQKSLQRSANCVFSKCGTQSRLWGCIALDVPLANKEGNTPMKKQEDFGNSESPDTAHLLLQLLQTWEFTPPRDYK